MIHAYDESYVNCAQHNLARMFDYGINTLHITGEQLLAMFIFTGYAERFGAGDCALVAGKSGIELTWEILDKLLIAHPDTVEEQSLERSPEYWVGWVMAYLQWYSGLTFVDIEKYLTFTTLREMYNPYHEMDVQQFVDRALEFYHLRKPDTNLKILRQRVGYTQSELAKLTDIPLRTLQQYEQRQKNINHAQAEYVVRLAKYLYCNIEELLEIA